MRLPKKDTGTGNDERAIRIEIVHPALHRQLFVNEQEWKSSGDFALFGERICQLAAPENAGENCRRSSEPDTDPDRWVVPGGKSAS